MNEKQKYNSLVVFGEGVTKSANKIIKFKKGIFLMNYPIKIEGLKYEGRIENSMCNVKTIESFAGICFNFYNKATYY